MGVGRRRRGAGYAIFSLSSNVEKRKNNIAFRIGISDLKLCDDKEEKGWQKKRKHAPDG